MGFCVNSLENATSDFHGHYGGLVWPNIKVRQCGEACIYIKEGNQAGDCSE